MLTLISLKHLLHLYLVNLDEQDILNFSFKDLCILVLCVGVFEVTDCCESPCGGWEPNQDPPVRAASALNL